MPQVPYTGVPTVSPRFDPTPEYHIDAPLAAFGGATAQAIERMGQTLGQTGNEMFTRAMAMQDLANRSEAAQGLADLQQEIGQVNGQYQASMGKDAVDGYDDSTQQVRDIVKKHIDSMSNPMAQKYLQQEALGSQGRTINHMALHLGQETKHYALGAASAKVQATRQDALNTVGDDDAFKERLGDAKDAAEAREKLKGSDPETIQLAQQKAVSDLYFDRIMGMAKTQPKAANDLLNKALKDNVIEGEDIKTLQNYVTSQARTVGARNIATAALSGNDLSYGNKALPMSTAEAAIGQRESGNDYGQRTNSGTVHGEALGRYQIMEDNLPEWLKEAGMKPMTKDQFLASPTAQNQLFEFKFGQLQEKYGNFNDAASAWLTGKPLAEAGTVHDRFGTNAQKYVRDLNGILAGKAGLTEIQDKVRAQAENDFKDDPEMPDAAVAAANTRYNARQAAIRNDQFQNRMDIDERLLVGDDGKLPKTIEDFRATPKGDAAWLKADNAQRLWIQTHLEKNAKEQAVTWDPGGNMMHRYNELRGMATNDPEEFLKVDPVNENLPNSAKLTLINVQQGIIKKSVSDVQTPHAMQILRPTLENAGITHSTDPTTYNRITGEVQDLLEGFQSANKRPARPDEVMDMGQKLLQQTVGKPSWLNRATGGLIGSAGTPLNQAQPDDAMANKIKQIYASTHNGTIPDDAFVQRTYVNMLYNSMFARKVGGAPTPAPTPKPPPAPTPVVPASQ